MTRNLSVATVLVLLFQLTLGWGDTDGSAAGPKKVAPSKVCARYGLPPVLADRPLIFAGAEVPLHRPDVQARILFQINYLLMDARGALTEWLHDRARYTWLFEEILEKEGAPREFALLSPVISGLGNRAEFRGAGAGWWFLSTQCGSSEGLDMSEAVWHDDRYDLELATTCFARRIKAIHGDFKKQSYLIAACVYLTSPKIITGFMDAWKTDVFWDLPMPDICEEIIVRWIAFSIIDAHQEFYGLRTKKQPPFVYDRISGVTLAMDLPVAVIAEITKVPAREILELNPKLKAYSGSLPATEHNKPILHTINAPKGKGNDLLKKLQQTGYALKNGS